MTSFQEKNRDMDMAAAVVGRPLQKPMDILDHDDMSFASIMKGTAAKPLTVFERKAALINLYVISCDSSSSAHVALGRLTTLEWESESFLA
jgi:hypothetical protein